MTGPDASSDEYRAGYLAGQADRQGEVDWLENEADRYYRLAYGDERRLPSVAVTRAELESLEKAGVLELRGEGETAGYTGIDLELLDILADVRRLGFGELFPIAIAEPYLAAVKKLGQENGFAVDATEDARVFTENQLKRYRAVVFLSTTGDVLDTAQQGAFERYIQAGGGYAGVHAASDTEYTWNWYGGLVGAYFSGHPDPQSATVEVADHAHPSTKHLPARWTRSDEWYNFQSNPRGKVHVLATLDETTYTGGGMGTEMLTPR